MQTLNWNDVITNAAEYPPSAMTIGVFDGVHLGHQALIRKVTERDFCPVVVTFRKNPKQVLAPRTYAGDIITLDEKLRIFECMGVQRTILIDFSEEFRHLKGCEFIELLIYKGNLRFLVVGNNFRCGYCLDTDAQSLKSITTKRGIGCEIVGPLISGGERISSSGIRAAMIAGDWAKAAAFLGREMPGISGKEMPHHNVQPF
ncbi:MAG: FAD synthetase family protein [Treponema sp.]|jgi:riboflavin kinase/FMN adenylyltransferase|nr:FAD synthetase family protein [Treponema sp.]